MADQRPIAKCHPNTEQRATKTLGPCLPFQNQVDRNFQLLINIKAEKEESYRSADNTKQKEDNCFKLSTARLHLTPEM